MRRTDAEEFVSADHLSTGATAVCCPSDWGEAGNSDLAHTTISSIVV